MYVQTFSVLIICTALVTVNNGLFYHRLILCTKSSLICTCVFSIHKENNEENSKWVSNTVLCEEFYLKVLTISPIGIIAKVVPPMQIILFSRGWFWTQIISERSRNTTKGKELMITVDTILVIVCVIVFPKDHMQSNAVRHVVDITQPVSLLNNNLLQKKINLKSRKVKIRSWLNS